MNSIIVIVLFVVVGAIALTGLVMSVFAFLDAKDAKDAADAVDGRIPVPTSRHSFLQPTADLNVLEWTDRPTVHTGHVPGMLHAAFKFYLNEEEANEQMNYTVPANLLKNVGDSIYIHCHGSGFQSGTSDTIDVSMKQGTTTEAIETIDTAEHAAASWMSFDFHCDLVKVSETELFWYPRRYYKDTQVPLTEVRAYQAGNRGPFTTIDTAQDFTLDWTYHTTKGTLKYLPIFALRYVFHPVSNS